MSCRPLRYPRLAPLRPGRWWLPVLWLALAPALGAATDPLAEVKAEVRRAFPEVPQLGTTALHEWLGDAARPAPLLLDVREPDEFAVSHLRGARRARDIDEALPLLAGVAPDAPIVAYCAVGYRSSALVRELRARGYTNVSNLEGSLFEWANRGLPLHRGERTARTVHPYNWWWGRYLDKSLRAR